MHPTLVLSEMPSEHSPIATAVPCVAPSRNRRSGALNSAVSPAGPRILLVDDDPTILHLTETVLIAAGYRVCSASDAKQALTILRRTPDISLLLTDVQLPPGIGGLELAEIVTNERPALPVIVISGAIMTPEQARLMRTRCWSFVDKPLLMPRLLSVISIVLRRPATRVSSSPITLPKAG